MDHCKFSTDPEGNITAGRGKLDDYGFWEFPCAECAERANNRAKREKEVMDILLRLRRELIRIGYSSSQGGVVHHIDQFIGKK